MKRTIRIPIRVKILLAVLFVVSAVVSIITFTMAHLFHVDKKAYVSDLASVISVHAADEASVVLRGYRGRVVAFAGTLLDPHLDAQRKAALLDELFSTGSPFVGVEVLEGGKTVGSVFDEQALSAAGLGVDRIVAERTRHPLPIRDVAAGHTWVANSTLTPRLPTMTLAVAGPAEQGKAARILVATLRLDELLEIGRQSQSFEVFLVGSDGVLLSHGNRALVLDRRTLPVPVELNDRSLAIVKEYSKNGQEMIGGFARVGVGKLVAGAQVPKAAAYFASRELLSNLIVVALVLLLAATLASVFWSRRITRSIVKLVDAARGIGKGRFDVHVEETSHDEIGLLARTFNDMAAELHARETALQQAQAQLVQSEKMAAFGQLGAGFAHEVKNPLAGILGVVQLGLRQVKEGEPMHTSLSLIDKETRRCKTIIDNLLKFARQEKVEHEPTDVAKVVEDAASIMNHQMSIKKVSLTTAVDPDLPRILGNGNQLQQVLMNLMLNAQQAMEPQGGGTVEVRARRDGNTVVITVKDTGPGIPKEIQSRIMEPFFTTKPAGMGTGLGLSVSFGILKDHRGELTLESAPGNGTTFFIRLPEAPAEAKRAA